MNSALPLRERVILHVSTPCVVDNKRSSGLAVVATTDTREQYLECGARPGSARDRYRASMCANDSMGDRESEPAARGFRREELVKDPRTNLRAYATTSIGHDQAHIVAGGKTGPCRHCGSRAEMCLMSCYLDRTLLISESFSSIDDEVNQHLAKLRSVAAHLG